MSHELLLPGQPLPLAQGAGVRAEEGAFEYADYVVSSCMGYPEISAGRARVRSIKPPLVIPRAESTVRFRRTQLTQVLGRVTRVNPRQATVSILVVDGLPCGGTLATGAGARGNHAAGEGIDGTDFQGIIRAQDVRVTDKDGVVMSECFRPGDIVRATVISLGDARSYYLSTARDHLGVVHATSSSAAQSGLGWAPGGRAMRPVSWKEMADPDTGIVEPRKCAKPDWL